MKSESTGWKVPLFIGTLVVTALFINFLFLNKASADHKAEVHAQQDVTIAIEHQKAADKLEQEKRDIAAKAEEKRKQDAAETSVEHVRLLTRYLNSDFNRPKTRDTIGVAIESELGATDSMIANALSQRLQSTNAQLLNSFFKPEFIADKYVKNIFSGDTAIFDRLELTNFLNGVLVGRQTVTYSTNGSLDNTVTANLDLELKFVPVVSSRENQSWDFSVTGVGMRPNDARQLAEKRMIEQIATSTNLALPEHL